MPSAWVSSGADMASLDDIRAELEAALQIIRVYAEEARYSSRDPRDICWAACDEGWLARNFLEKRTRDRAENLAEAA
jgi:hypothetical protein